MPIVNLPGVTDEAADDVFEHVLELNGETFTLPFLSYIPHNHPADDFTYDSTLPKPNLKMIPYVLNSLIVNVPTMVTEDGGATWKMRILKEGQYITVPQELEAAEAGE